MNSIHNNGESDKSLKDELEQLGQTYEQIAREEPPELLDTAILNSAHRAVEKKPRWMKFGWLHGLTTAAVFVLAFSLVLNQREPTPGIEDGMRSAEPASLQKQEAARKRPQDVQGGLGKEMMPKDDRRNDSLQSMPVATTQESEANAAQSRKKAMESKLSNYARAVMQAKTTAADKDMETDELRLEEASLNDAAVMTDAPAAAPVTGPREAQKAGEQSQTEAGLKLRDIIKLKQSGDPAWVAQLESFIDSYPDYPLPEELRNP